MGLPSPGESLQEGDSICLEDQQAGVVCLQVLSPSYCLVVNENFPDGVICVESVHGSLCSVGTPGNPGVVREDMEGQWNLGGVMVLSNCQTGFPFWVTSAEYFVDWIKDLMVQQ